MDQATPAIPRSTDLLASKVNYKQIGVYKLLCTPNDIKSLKIRSKLRAGQTFMFWFCIMGIEVSISPSQV